MNNEYPKMIYKAGTSLELNDGRVDTLIVEDKDAEDIAIAERWFLTTPEALAPKVEQVEKTLKLPKKE
jgi:hypothetical protein